MQSRRKLDRPASESDLGPAEEGAVVLEGPALDEQASSHPDLGAASGAATVTPAATTPQGPPMATPSTTTPQTAEAPKA